VTGELVPTDYYNVGEVAEMLHVSHSTVRRRILEGDWPHLTIAQGHYLNAEMVADVVAMHTSRPNAVDKVAADPPPALSPRLGTPVDPEDLEGFR
jgi:hypothetical protein